MGYETRLLIGHLMEENNNLHYFLKLAEVDLSKCGYEGNLPDLIGKAVGTENALNLKQAYYSKQFKVQKDKTMELVQERERQNFLHISDEDFNNIVNKTMQLSEEWEDYVTEDSYGSTLRAVPIERVIEAMSEDMAFTKLSGEPPYRRYEMALPLLKTVKKRWKGNKIYCILFGY